MTAAKVFRCCCRSGFVRITVIIVISNDCIRLMANAACDVGVVKNIIMLHGEVRNIILSNLIIMASFVRITLGCYDIVTQIAITH